MLGERILPYGPLSARVLVVGDIPLYKEGSETWEMWQLLQAAGISREDVRVTSVSQYRCPDHLKSTWVAPKPAGLDPMTLFNKRYANGLVMEGIHCLEAEINRLQPNVIVAFGDWALWALTGKSGIANWRGSIMPCSLVEGFKVIPTFHPSFTFKSYADRVDMIADLRRAEQNSGYRGIRLPDWTFHLQPTLHEALRYLEDLGPLAVVDIETARKQIKCIGIGRSKTEAMCIPFTQNGNPEGYWSKTDEVTVIAAISQALRKRKIVNQNMLYDSFYLSWLWGLRLIPVFDTMIAQGVAFPGRPKSLDYLASLHCDYYSYWKHDKKDWEGYQDDRELWHYNCQDDVYTWEVAQSLAQVIDSLDLRKQFDFEMSQFEPIHTMMLRGVASSPVNRAAMSYQLDVAVHNRWRDMEKMVGHKFNPNSPLQLSKFFYIDMKIPEIRNRRTKNLTTDDDALLKIAAREPLLLPITNRIAEARSLRLVKSNFVDIETPDGRLYTSYNPVGTVTFRYNSSTNPMGYGTNLQNILHIEEDDLDAYPSDMPNVRELFIPDPGYVLAEFDLSKADLRVVVWESEEQELKNLLIAGRNIYKEVGSEATGLPYRRAKMLIHGTDYGGSPRTMGINCGITTAQAKAAQDKWFARYPGIKRWQERVEARLKLDRTVANKLGFRIMYFDRPDSILPEALAWGPQSTVAIVINTIVRWIYDEYECVHDDSVQLLMQVHDSVVVQIRREVLDFHARRILAQFNTVVVPYDDQLVIPADCKIGEVSWAHMEKYSIDPVSIP